MVRKRHKKSGFEHILLEHGDQFAKQGISVAELPDLIIKSLKNGNIIGYQGRIKGRPIYEVVYKGKTRRIAITVGSNGYIVGGNPVSIK